MMGKLRLKQKRFALEYIKNGGNGTQAVIDAGYNVKSRAVARTRVPELLSSPNVQALLAEILPDEKLFKVHEEGLDAVKPSYSPNGEKTYEKDFSTRHKYLETGYKIKGMLHDAAMHNTQINIISSDQQRAIAERILKIHENRAKDDK